MMNNTSSASSHDDEAELEELPIINFRQTIVNAIRSHQIIICIGETGSGKTTKIPQFCLEEGILSDRKMAITQPRRVAAIAMAKRVSEERNTREGVEVGYSIRFDDNTTSHTKIKYMTDGILVRECLYDKDLSEYAVIMLDEAHERSLNTDILFGLVKDVCKRRSDIRILITSATLDEGKFSTYFNHAPVIRVPGRVYPVDIFHSKIRQVMTTSGPANSSYVNDAVDLALQIHQHEDFGHILIFLTGQNEIDKACELIRSELSQIHHDSRDDNNDENDMVVIPLYGALSGPSQQNIFKKYRSCSGNTILRKCIVATNIAETSITVPSIRYVIDCGYVKQKTFDPTRHMESLIIVPISQVSAQQRAGRAGRTGPGKCYRLYSSDCFQNMMNETVPEILRTNLANTILYLKVLGIHDILAFDFLDPPSESQALEALTLLHQLGALDNYGEATSIGKQMSYLPLEPSLSRSIVASIEYNCMNEVITIAAMLSVESIWVEPSKQQKRNNATNAKYQSYLDAMEEAHSKLRHISGDHVTYLQIFHQYESAGERSKEWCEEYFIHHRSVSTAVKIRDQIIRDLHKDIKETSSSRSKSGSIHLNEDTMKNVIKSLLHGHYMNAVRCCSGIVTSLSALNSGTNTFMYRTLPIKRDDEVMMVYIHPSSVLSYFPTPHQYLIYQELTTIGGKTYIRHATGVKDTVLAKYSSSWKELPNSLMLTGRVVELIPRSDGEGRVQSTRIDVKMSIMDDSNNDTGTGTRTGNQTQTAENMVKRNVSQSAIDEAKERFLARKKIKR